MKLKFTFLAFAALLLTQAQAQIWHSYDWFNNPPEPSPVIGEIAFKGDTTWIGTVESGLGWSTDDTTWNVIDTANSDLPDNHITALAFDHDGNLWIGSDTHVVKYDGATWTVYNSTNAPELPGKAATDFAIDPDNNLWVSFMLGGVAKFDGTTWTHFNAFDDGIPHDWVRGVAAQSNGDVWIATGSGAGKYDGSTWTTYDMSNTTLVNDYFMSVAVDSSDNVWFGASGGAAIFNGTTWTSYTPLNTFAFNDPVMSITFDAADNVWFATMLSGIVKFDGTAFTEYNMSNTNPPLPSNEIMVALANGCSNDVYFGTNSGLAIFDDTLTAPDCVQDTTSTFINALVENGSSISAKQNPSESGLVELVCGAAVSGDYQIVLTDILGRVVVSQSATLTHGVTLIPVQLNASGVYFATMRNNVSSVTSRLIVR